MPPKSLFDLILVSSYDNIGNDNKMILRNIPNFLTSTRGAHHYQSSLSQKPRPLTGWNPDAIVFNSNQAFGTPSYWVQHMFGESSGAMFLKSQLTADPTSVAASAILWQNPQDKKTFLKIKEAIDQIMTQSTNDESEISPNDAVGKVFGEEHSGRVRTMGMGAAPTNTFRNTKLRLSNVSHSSAETATSSSFTQWQERYLRLENALKAYMIMKEGSIPEELADFFAPQPEPGDASSEPTTPLDARRSSGGSNTNHQ